MVGSEVVEFTRDRLGAPRKILVTGATGFVGRCLAHALYLAGHDVIATGRNHYLISPEIPFVRADIRLATSIQELCRDRDVVVHCASDTSPWGSYSKLAATNVEGTKNVIAGCRQHNVSRLVHVSSTSVQFDFRDAMDVDEDSPAPRRFACNYARTKQEAEEVVRSACASGLNSIIIRARAVIGPGDQNLLPRILKAYDQGRLRQIGDGTNVTDLTYIDNLVQAIVLAIDNGSSGETVTVTGDEPVGLWKLVRQALASTNRNAVLKKTPYSLAYLVASLLESWHWVRGRPHEPALTRYTVGLLAKNQTFNKRRSQQELKYRPIIEQQEGIRRTLAALASRSDTHSPVSVNVRFFTTGYTLQPFHFIERGAERQKVAVHASFAVIEHPRFGLTLFDTGYSPHFHEASRRWPYRAYAKMTPVVTNQDSQCKSVLEKAGIESAQIKRIIVSHFHADHICGLRDFPEADIIAKKEAWQSVAGVKGIEAMRRAFLPALLPADIQERLFLLPSFADPGIGPFPQSHDLFFDGSVRLIDLPGHASGQIGALLQTGAHSRSCLVADAVWTRKTITKKLDPTLPFLALAADSGEAKKTVKKLYQLHQVYGDIEIVPTHCREIATSYGFDQEFSLTAESVV